MFGTARCTALVTDSTTGLRNQFSLQIGQKENYDRKTRAEGSLQRDYKENARDLVINTGGCITLIIARMPKINDPRDRCRSGEKDNRDRRRYSGRHDKNVTIPLTVSGAETRERESERERLREFRMRARNASQNRLQSD